jgi:hypothetical protein
MSKQSAFLAFSELSPRNSLRARLSQGQRRPSSWQRKLYGRISTKENVSGFKRSEGVYEGTDRQTFCSFDLAVMVTAAFSQGTSVHAVLLI